MELFIGKKIGEGACSEVYEWEDGSKIVKIAKPNVDRFALEREFRNTQIAWEIGLPAPRPYEIVNVQGRPAVVYERVYGETFMERFLKWGLSHHASQGSGMDGDDIRATARTLHKIHSNTEGSQLRNQRDHLKAAISHVGYLTSGEKEAVAAHLDRLPLKQHVCHGDPNPNNMIIDDRGKVVAIDWMDAVFGNPEADLAEYIIMIQYAVLPPEVPEHITEVFEGLRSSLVDIFMEEYTRLTGIRYDEVEPWIPVIATRKLLATGVQEKEKRVLVDVIRQWIS